MSEDDLAAVGLLGPALDAARRLAVLAVGAGARAIVCSPQEVAAIRAEVPRDIVLITPGVRPAGAALGDQQRVATPEQAIADGADLLVIGRPITGAPDVAAAAAAIAPPSPSPADSVLHRSVVKTDGAVLRGTPLASNHGVPGEDLAVLRDGRLDRHRVLSVVVAGVDVVAAVRASGWAFLGIGPRAAAAVVARVADAWTEAIVSSRWWSHCHLAEGRPGAVEARRLVPAARSSGVVRLVPSGKSAAG